VVRLIVITLGVVQERSISKIKILIYVYSNLNVLKNELLTNRSSLNRDPDVPSIFQLLTDRTDPVSIPRPS